MTSFGSNIRKLPGWNPTFTVQGQICHRIGSLYPQQDAPPQFMQIYFIDSRHSENEIRMTIAGKLQPRIVAQLTEMFHNVNKYVKNLKIAVEIINQSPGPDLSVVIHEDKRPSNQHVRCYNVPTGNEVGILLPNEPSSK